MSSEDVKEHTSMVPEINVSSQCIHEVWVHAGVNKNGAYFKQ